MREKIIGRCLCIFAIFLSCGISVYGQQPLGAVGGIVYEKNLGSPIARAHVQLENEDFRASMSTDEQGYFAFRDIPLGRYDISVRHIGFLQYLQKDVLIEAGKKPFLRMGLEPGPIMLDDVEILSGEISSHIEALSMEGLEWEQSQRLAGTFYDPARLATTFPGVLGTNDQSNQISIRGHTPNHVLWKIEGIDFVNPNHLTNAGTLSDRPSISGGGVSILSAQLMDNSTLRKGAYPPGYGNALGGIFDVRLRRGNREEKAFTLQAGFLGLEAGAEGPIGSNGKSGYLASYRYSTIGLMSAMGLDVGDESIDFQDLSFKIDLETEHAGTFSLFGLGGLSNENFDAQRDPSEWETSEDRIDTKFYSNMGGLGLTHNLPLTSNIGLTNKLAYSAIKSAYEAGLVTDSLTLADLSRDMYQQSQLSWLTEVDFRISGRHDFSAGLQINRIAYHIESEVLTDTARARIRAKGSDGITLVQPFVGWDSWLGKTWQLHAGLHIAYTPFNGEFIPQPRFTVTKLFDKGDLAMKAHYGMVSQINPPQAYFYLQEDNETGAVLPNKYLGAPRSHHWVLGIQQKISSTLSLHAELYLQHHYKVPISTDTSSTYSLLNATDGFIVEPLTNRGTGRNIGIDIMLNKHFEKNWYFAYSGSIFDSRYRTWDHKDRNTRFNAQFSSTLSIGKEFEKQFTSKNRLFGFNMRAIFHAGYWTTPILESASTAEGSTVYDMKNAYSDRLPAYFRTDVRLYFKINKRRYTRTLSLDIQNVTNRKNVSYRIYDPLQNSPIYQYQLGILPVLSYRVEF
jgi:hypothetical protein